MVIDPGLPVPAQRSVIRQLSVHQNSSGRALEST